MLTPEQVAQRCQVRPRTVLEWLRSGRLRGVKLGKLWRIEPTDLRAFVAANASDADWKARFDALLARVRARVPPEFTQEQIEADAVAAVHEARDLLRARHG